MAWQLLRHLSDLSIDARVEKLERAGEIAIATALESLKIRTAQTIDTGRVVLIGASLIGISYLLVLPPWRVAGWVIPVIIGALISSRISRNIQMQLRGDCDARTIVHLNRPVFAYVVMNTLIMGSGIWWTGYGILDNGIWFATTTVAALYTLGALINSCLSPVNYIVGTCCNLGLVAAFWFTTGIAGFAVAFTILGLIVLFMRFSFKLRSDFEKLVRIRFENLELARKLENERLIAISAQHEAEKANLAKSQFLAAASHDLRQPLHALMLFSNLLDTSSADQHRVLIAHIRSAADSLNHLFNGLLDLSKLDAGAIKPQLTNVNLAPLIESLGSEFGAKARQKGLLFDMQMAEMAAITDPFLLERILRNLLDNAVKYTPRGFIRFLASDDGERVKIRIEDSGIGVEEEFQETIFSEFFQINNPARNAEHGTGLGLSIVRRLCNLMGHNCDLTSRAGIGSCFSVELLSAALPCRVQDTLHASISDYSALRGLRVLIIDDDSRVRFAMQRLLQSWQCDVITAASSRELAASLLAHRPHALIADYRLAESKTGFDVIEELRARWPLLPAAIFTGDTEAHYAEASRMTDIPVFQKPVEASQIARWLIAAVHRQATTPV